MHRTPRRRFCFILDATGAGSLIRAVRPNMKWLSSLLRLKRLDPPPTLIDPDFGKISFDGQARGIWQTHDDIEDLNNHAKYGFSSIPGDRGGPFPQSRTFLLQKTTELPELWRICTPALEEACERWKAKGLKKPVVGQFILSSISIDEDFESSGVWDVG